MLFEAPLFEMTLFKMTPWKVSYTPLLGLIWKRTQLWFHFPQGGHLIDSPGIREFGLWHMSEEDVIDAFVEFRPFLGRCKFRDCGHEHEPECALRDALEEGKIQPSRMASYRQIISSTSTNK